MGPSDTPNETRVDSGAVALNDGSKVSVQLLQSVYNELTGKTEKLRKRISHKFCADAKDLRNLNEKITQISEQYNVQGKNCSVTVYYLKDRAEQFSSFDRFTMYDSSGLSPVENIRIIYDLLILLPNVNKPQTYKIQIDVTSQVGVQARLDEEEPVHRKFLRIFSGQSGEIEIDYVDYNVARNFENAIIAWFDGLDAQRDSRTLTILKENSGKIPHIFRFSTVAIITLAFLLLSNNYVLELESTIALYKISLIAFSTIYLGSLISFTLGQSFEMNIDQFQRLSWIHLNKGDQNARNQYEKKNSSHFRIAIFNTLYVVLLNIAASIIAAYILQ